ncbi:hypothetical protein [Sphingobacterium sp. DR205]|uniref:DUF6414 family protein n=1 Tax=Sphingobacterium sp. DR205 TaxID=2713573 RepID=UPI0013E46A14|nr:hypothetical protein [Sphingobacterium sp. DR205]QIH36880.1 hypothetical protein G6053_30310 [Sphingobacterium sp. DR205]
MKKLRSFLYLDNYKMYSISSQLFEGLTEYILRSESAVSKEEEKQKGPVFSGKVLADIIETNSNQTEKKFLHDYSYNLFEETLIGEGRVLEISSETDDDVFEKLDDYSFLKITGNIIFNDVQELEKTMSQFNQTGEALGYITCLEEYKNEVAEIQQSVNDVKDRNKKAHLNNLLKNKASFSTYLKEKGLQMDEGFLKHLGYLLRYGYHQQLEVQVPILRNGLDLNLFSAQLDRKNLKENEQTMIKKFSRETEKKFTLFGILTQKLDRESKEELFAKFSDAKENPSMKEAISNVVKHMGNVENTFNGKSDYEFIIDPIALYLEI